MNVTLRLLAELVHGTVVGDGELVIRSARTIQEAQAGDITFVESAKNGPQLAQSQASAALVPHLLSFEGKTLIQVADPLTAFVAVFQHFQGKPAFKPSGIHPNADVHPSAHIGADASIGPLVSIGAGCVIGQRSHLHSGVVLGKNCRIGDDVLLYPGVVLYEDIVLGDRVIIHGNAVIGADGFGYRFLQGKHVKVPQLSNVIIGSDVEIGACSCIDRGTFAPTRIGDGTKIDNLVHIAHNCRIGKHNALAALVGIAGSSSTGDYVVMGGQAGVVDHVHVGDGTMLACQTGVTHSFGPGEVLFGMPARPLRGQKRVLATMEKLPAMRQDLERIKKILGLSQKDEKAA